MSQYSQTFSITDILNNKKLYGKLPLINYKEVEREDGKVSRRTNAKTVNRFIFVTAISSARPFYRPILPSRSGNLLVIGGTLVGDHNEAVDAVYQALVASKSIISLTANTREMLMSAVKETEKNKRKYGIDSKLYLRVKSMQQIEAMSKQEIFALLQNIMENIFYGDDFPETQKKFQVDKLYVKSSLNYNQRKEQWKRKVGDE